MKYDVLRQEGIRSSRQTDASPRESSVGRLSMAPPESGVDFVDRGDLEVAQRMEASPPAGENRTGMPDTLKGGLERLSGLDLSGVRVRYNSAKPARVNARAYTQGRDIEIGPGQERHLPHEAWHAVQQMQGRVKPTMQAQGLSINDDKDLEHEADVMGAKALQIRRPQGSYSSRPFEPTLLLENQSVIQARFLAQYKVKNYMHAMAQELTNRFGDTVSNLSTDAQSALGYLTSDDQNNLRFIFVDEVEFEGEKHDLVGLTSPYLQDKYYDPDLEFVDDGNPYTFNVQIGLRTAMGKDKGIDLHKLLHAMHHEVEMHVTPRVKRIRAVAESHGKDLKTEEAPSDIPRDHANPTLIINLWEANLRVVRQYLTAFNTGAANYYLREAVRDIISRLGNWFGDSDEDFIRHFILLVELLSETKKLASGFPGDGELQYGIKCLEKLIVR